MNGNLADEEKLYATAVQKLNLLLRRSGADQQVLIVSTRVTISEQLQKQLEDYCRTHHRIHQVGIQFTVRAGQRQALEIGWTAEDVESEPSGPAGLDPGARVLTVMAGSDVAAYTLEPAPQWLSFGRFDAVGARRPAGVWLPPSASVVPKGELLVYRFRNDELLLRRTSERSRPGQDWVEIALDGLRLAPDHTASVTVGSTVVVEYRRTAGVSTVSLELGDTDGADLVDGSLSAPLPGTSVRVSGPGTVEVTIAPPAAGLAIGVRDFSVCAPTMPSEHAGDRWYPLYAQVLLTEGTGRDGSRWHVKIYRGATSAHARILYRFLAAQAELLTKAAFASPDSVFTAVHITDIAATTGRAPITKADPAPAVVMADSDELVLASWFGIPAGPAADCYVVVLAPLLTKLPAFDRDGRNPDPIDTPLKPLRRLAVGLDAAHRREIAHGDVKADNICLHPVDGRYVLVDADSVSAVTAPVAAHRTTWEFAAPGLVARSRGEAVPDAVPIRTSDRFAFALLVVAAVADNRRLGELLQRRPTVAGPADDPDSAREVIESFWAPSWSAFAAVLAEGLDEQRIRGDRYRLEAWMDRLDVAWSGKVDSDDPANSPPSVEVVHRREIESLHDAAQNHGRGDVDAALRAAMTRHRIALAQRAYRQAFLGPLVLTVTLALLILFSVGGMVI